MREDRDSMVRGDSKAQRHAVHKNRMLWRRAEQLSRTANCSIWGLKRVAKTPTGWIYGPRDDEQGAYRAKHWRTA